MGSEAMTADTETTATNQLPPPSALSSSSAAATTTTTQTTHAEESNASASVHSSASKSVTSSKKRSREGATTTAAANLHTAAATPAALQTSLQQIHQSLSLNCPPTASLPAFQALLHSYLVPNKQASSINVPHLLRHNMLSSISTLAHKHLNDDPPYVHLNTRDAAPQLQIDGEKLTVKGGMRGYRMVRGSQGVEAGGWYYEVEVLPPPSVQEVVRSLPENVRLGEGVREGFRRGVQREQERMQEEQEEQEGQQEEEEKKKQENGTNSNHPPPVTNATLPKKKKRRLGGTAEDGGRMSEEGVEQYSIGGHLRIGWSMRTGELQAPVGYDRWSYGIRDIQGSRIHKSQREDKWGGVGFRPGDVVGFAIGLLDKEDAVGMNVSRLDEGMPSTSHNSTTAGNAASSTTTHPSYHKKIPSGIQSNHIRFFKNGAPMGHFVVSRGIKSGGEAFDHIEPGTYYPALSCYMGATARVNFGPYFLYPPKGLPTGMKLQPMSDTCPKPMAPDQVLAWFKKEKCILKKVEEDITQAIHDAVFLEAQMRYESYQKHWKDHVEFVRRGRNERGLATSDLPEPEPVAGAGAVPPSDALEDATMSEEVEERGVEETVEETAAATKAGVMTEEPSAMASQDNMDHP